MPRVDFPKQEIVFAELGSQPLQDILALSVPANVGAGLAFKQLSRVQDYVRDNEMGCNVAVVERHYIDRDFMEDYSVFYSRNLWPYPNWCQRVHFFRASGDEPHTAIRRQLEEIATTSKGLTPEAYRARCAAFSQEHYFGFSVIKPLTGTPVGRTVLRPFPDRPQDASVSAKGDGAVRSFEPTRLYKAHLLGVELSVRGIAFQQQDTGVAACATTAIWSSLQKVREHEDIGATTPAHITARATMSRSLGRSMPSEGLSIGQMCQAVEAFGISPVLNVGGEFLSAREQLHSACISGCVPVLGITDSKRRAHAIAAVGMRLEEPKERAFANVDQDADRLTAIFVHDDRYGPYLRARLFKQADGKLGLSIRTMKAPRTPLGTRVPGTTDDEEEWTVTHILVPTHPKIRLSFSELRRLAGPFIQSLWSYWQSLGVQPDAGTGRLSYRVWIPKSHAYLEQMAIGDEFFPSALANAIGSKVALSRYLAVLRLRISGAGQIDLLIDSTGTFRNPAFIGIACSESMRPELRHFAQALARTLRCPIF